MILKEIKKLNNDGIQELIDITTYVNEVIDDPKKHSLLDKKSKLNYYMPENVFEYFINYDSIYFTSNLYFGIDKKEKADYNKDIYTHQYKTAFQILKDTVKEILKTYKETKATIKLSKKISDLFFISDTDTMAVLETFTLTFTNLMLYYKEQEENVFNYCIVFETGNKEKPFKELKEYNAFKRKIKALYKECLTVLNSLSTSTITDIIPYEKHATTPKLKILPFFTNNKFPDKTDKLYDYYYLKNEKGGILATLKMPKGNNITPFDTTLLIYMLIHYNENSNITEININDYFKLTGNKDKKDLTRNIKSSCEKLLSFNYTVSSNNSNIGVNIIDNYKIENSTGKIIWTQGFKEALKENKRKIMLSEIHNKYFALNKQDLIINNIALCLNNHFTYTKNNIKQHQYETKKGFYCNIQIETLLKHTNLNSKNNNRNRYTDIINTLEIKLNSLLKIGFLLDWYYIDKQNKTSINTDKIKPAELIKQYICYSMQPTTITEK